MYGEIAFQPNPNPPLREGLVRKRGESIRPAVAVGKTIVDEHGDEYLVKKMLGEGGMGAVYQIEQKRTELDRALKIIRPGWYSEMPAKERENVMKRFRREMEMLSRVHSPFILPVVDIIEIKSGEGVILGFVTDMIEGTTLQKEIETERNGVPCDRAVEYAGEIAMALATLDDVGFVHRDLKPANIFLEHMPDGKKFVRVGDFGLATISAEAYEKKEPSDAYKALVNQLDTSITDPGNVMGTPDFMAPEQAAGGFVTHKTDLYALGCIMYEMVTRRPVFSGKFHQVMYKHVHEKPESFKDLRINDVPEWFEAIVMKLLEKNPDDRFASAKEVFVALKEGAKKDYPHLLNDVPFMWNVGSDIDSSRFTVASASV